MFQKMNRVFPNVCESMQNNNSFKVKMRLKIIYFVSGCHFKNIFEAELLIFCIVQVFVDSAAILQKTSKRKINRNQRNFKPTPRASSPFLQTILFVAC